MIILLFAFLQVKSQDTLLFQGNVLLDKEFCIDSLHHCMQGFTYQVFQDKQTKQVSMREYGYNITFILWNRKETVTESEAESKIKELLK